MSETYHGSRERVSWAVKRNDSTLLFGENEEAARADYAHRAKTLHRGESIRLERLVVTEAWVQHLDVIDHTAKPPAPQARAGESETIWGAGAKLAQRADWERDYLAGESEGDA